MLRTIILKITYDTMNANKAQLIENVLEANGVIKVRELKKVIELVKK